MNSDSDFHSIVRQSLWASNLRLIGLKFGTEAFVERASDETFGEILKPVEIDFMAEEGLTQE